MKKFFKYLLLGLGTVILLVALGTTLWWNLKTDREKSSFFANVHDFETAIEYDPSNSKAWMERSVAFNKAGNFEKGFEFLNKAVELDPQLHLGYRGWIRLRKIRDYDQALQDFDRLDSLTPNVVDAPWGEAIDFLRGECYFGKREYAKAMALFERNINNEKEAWADVHSFVYLGLCEYELGNFENAITQFQRGLKQSNKLPEAHFGMAKAYQKLGQLENAQAHVLKAEATIAYKREDVYNEFLNEIYLSEIMEFKELVNKQVK
ncbi:MAG: tetratricopeptide repeat protein [Croceitalea sp.]|nr:tetratricopeptide repeat protein [Croceitalea sp.]